MKNYLEVLPLKHVLLFGGGGSSGGGSGGGTTTNTTTNQMMPWGAYVPEATNRAYQEKLLPYVSSQTGMGLTPQQKSQFTGQGMSEVAKSSAASNKSLSDSLARSGARGGAVTQAYSDAARGKVMANQGVTSNIQGLDVQQTGANLDRTMKAIALPGSPITVGSSGVTNYAPKSSGGGGS